MKKLLRLISVATMLLAATTFMACSSDDDDDSSGARSVSARNSGSVVGVVLDNKGAPVDGATVTLGGKSVTTNKGGEFEITGVNPNDKSLITARKSNTTTSTATDGADGGSLKTENTETALSSTTSSVAGGETAYKLTVTKDGYLPGTITGVYVTYTETEEQEVTRANALLHGLQYDYQDVLKAYAASLAQSNTIATTTTTATEDTTATTTTQTGSDADRVFKDLSEAISALKNMYKTGSYTEYFSTFGTSSALIPLDASLKGSLKLNLTSKEGTTWAETTYKPTSKPTIHVSYGVTGNADYTWSAQADADGIFEFKEKLPSGVALTISVDSFQETIESNDYWFSSESMIVLVDNSGAEEATTGVKTVTLGSKDVNSETYRFLLFAQNDKLWVTKTNTETTTTGVLLTKNDPLTFTFNKAVKAVDIVTGSNATTGFNNLTKDAYDAKISEDGKTVTFTPKIGYWDLSTTATSTAVKLSAEAVDGTKVLVKDTFPVYFDNKVWVSVKDLSYDDYNDLRALKDPIVLVFSKPMNEKIAVTLTNNNTAYTESWNEGFTELTLTPDAKVGYWDLGSETTIVIKIADAYANSKDSYINNFGFWKVGAAADGKSATVHFDNYNDVTIAKADKGFTATFAKAIKAQTESELKANLKVYNVGASYKEEFTVPTTGELTDVVLALSDDGTTITVTPQNTEFANYGYYALSFAKDKFIARTGERIPRKPATTKTVEDFGTTHKTPFVTTFTLGTEFKYTAVTVVDKLPESALASRAIYVDNDKYLKITFNKAVRTSALKIGTTTVTNYIDGSDVYLPLASLADNADVKVKGTVTSTDGQKWDKVTDSVEFDTLYKVNKLSYKMVATSLYTVKKAIAEGAASTSNGNDALVNKIAPAETTITFTFDQNVEGATWTSEFYDALNVGKKNLDQTPYKAAAAAAGKVVTVTLSGKDRDFNETYYLSLKATKGTGDDVVVLYDSSDVNSAYGPLPGDATKKLNSEIITTAASNSKNYIKVLTKTEKEVAGLDNLYVVDVSNNKASKTTLIADFEKSINSPIVLEFSESVEGFTAVLANGLYYDAANSTGSSTNWLTKDNVDAIQTFESASVVGGDDKNILTITPTYAFTSEAAVYPVVFDKEGKRFPLKKADDTDFVTATTATKPVYYKAAKLSFTSNKADNKLTNDLLDNTKSTKLVLANFDAKNVGNGSTIYFSFTPINSTRKTGIDYGTYTLYRKITGINDAATVWENVGSWSVGGTGTVKALAAVDTSATETWATGETDSNWVKSYQKNITANNNSFALSKLDACIMTTTDAAEFNFAAKSKYKLVLKLDNDEIHSNIIDVEDKKLNAKLAWVTTPTAKKVTQTGDEFTVTLESEGEVDWADNTLTFTAPCYLKEDVKVVLTKGTTVAGDSANADKRIGVGAISTATSAYDANTGVTTVTIKVTAKNGTDAPMAAQTDSIKISGKDVKGVERLFTIKFVK